METSSEGLTTVVFAEYRNVHFAYKAELEVLKGPAPTLRISDQVMCQEGICFLCSR